MGNLRLEIADQNIQIIYNESNICVVNKNTFQKCIESIRVNSLIIFLIVMSLIYLLHK